MRTAFFVGLVASATLLGCPRATPAEAIMPKAPTAAEALGSSPPNKCTAVDDYGKPLIVDLKGEERGDFETAMKEGITVVAYDCDKLKLVDGCSVAGSYGFLGFSPKEELVRLENGDELKANLPVSAGIISAKLSAEMERGMTLDIAMMMIGKRRTTRKSTRRSELVEDRAGACKGATHFVRGATIGAFAMDTGSRAKTRAAAELLGIPHLGSVGASGGSSANRLESRRDGQVEDCKQASPDASSAPARCSALLRLELTRIDPTTEPASAAEAHRGAPALAHDDEDRDACPAGFVTSAGKCAPASSSIVHRCAPNDVKDCEEQCAKGDAASCGRFGAILSLGKGVSVDMPRAATFFKKACEGGWMAGCGSLGALQVFGDGVPKSPELGLPLLQKACDAGAAPFCSFVGIQYTIGRHVPKDSAKAIPFLKRGCDGGVADSCVFLGDAYLHGDGGLARDLVKGAQMERRACEGGHGLGCIGFAQALFNGLGVPKDEARAAATYQSVCEGRSPFAGNACSELAKFYRAGRGVPKDDAKADELMKKAASLSPTRGPSTDAPGTAAPSSATAEPPSISPSSPPSKGGKHPPKKRPKP
jgi:TPR repeat protein